MSVEKLKEFKNFVTIRGTLIDLERHEGVYPDSQIAWVTLEGSIQYGDTAIETVRFRSQASATKADGTESKAYANLLSWADAAVPATKNPDNPTKVTAYGTINHNVYPSAKYGKVVDTTMLNIKSFKEYTPPIPDAMGDTPESSTINVEGYVLKIRDEVKGGGDTEQQPTGRLKFDLLALNYKKEPVIIKNIVVPAEYNEAFCDMFSDPEYCTAEFILSWRLHRGESKPVEGGLGKARLTSGKDYNELTFIWCSKAYTEEEKGEDALITSEVKRELIAFHDNQVAMAKTKLEGEVAAGGIGGKATKPNSSINKELAEEGFSSPIADEEDDMPF